MKNFQNVNVLGILENCVAVKGSGWPGFGIKSENIKEWTYWYFLEGPSEGDGGPYGYS